MVETSKFDSDEDPPIVFATALPPASAPYYDDDGNNHHLSSFAGSTIRTEWNCPKCTLINPITKEYCDACYHCQPNFPESTTGDNTRFPPTAEEEDNYGMFSDTKNTGNVDPRLVVLDDDINITQEYEHEHERRRGSLPCRRRSVP